MSCSNHYTTRSIYTTHEQNSYFEGELQIQPTALSHLIVNQISPRHTFSGEFGLYRQPELE